MLIKRIKSFLYPYLYRRQDMSLQKQEDIMQKHDEIFHRLEKLKIYIDYQKDEINKNNELICEKNSQHIISTINEQNIQLKNEHSMIKQKLEKLSQKVEALKDRISCIFLVHNISAWDSLSPVYHAMLNDDDFEPVVMSINKKFPGEVSFAGEEAVNNYLTSVNIKHIRLKSEDSYEDLEIIKALNPDVIFRQSQWDPDIPPAFSTDELKFSHLAYVPYEIMNFLGNVDPNIENSLFHQHCSMLFVANKYAYDSLKENSGINEDRIFITGHPKVEKLLSSEGKWPINWPDGRKNYRVLWGAHHSIDDKWSNFGTFLTLYPQMLEWAKNHPDIDIVFSPHPALLTTLQSEKYEYVRESIDLFLKEWDELPNTAIFQNNTYSELFKASDALVIDGISWLLEYQLLNKPVIFLEREDHLPFLESGEIIANSVYRVADFNGVKETIEHLIVRSEDPHEEERKATLNKLLHIDNASENILRVIKRTLR